MLDIPAVAPRFITFEGGEGVGKSTQVKRLLVRLNRLGIEAVRTREPGGTPKAEHVRMAGAVDIDVEAGLADPRRLGLEAFPV